MSARKMDYRRDRNPRAVLDSDGFAAPVFRSYIIMVREAYFQRHDIANGETQTAGKPEQHQAIRTNSKDRLGINGSK